MFCIHCVDSPVLDAEDISMLKVTCIHLNNG